ncbi:MAG: TonB-dependent receptor plug domain-containing protein [Bacteroidota bacterium]
MKQILLICTLLLGVSVLYAQPLPGTLAEKIQTRFDRHHLLFPQEKVFLHLDKDTYLLGDPIWFQAYLVESALHLPSPLSTVLYVDLVSPEDKILSTLPIRMEAGRGKGDFQIDRKWEPGTYMIRAYTQFMRNFESSFLFTQELLIENPYKIFRGEDEQNPGDNLAEVPAKYAVQFFPEGGDLVEGLVSIMGIKAVDEAGNGIAVSGLIKNKDDQEVGRFQTGTFGLGSFPFKPEPNQKYRAEVEYQGSFQKIKLPKALEQGFVMQAGVSPEHVTITLQSNTADGLTGGVLFGHIRGQVFGTLDDFSGKAMRFKLPLSALPSGVAHFTLFNAEGLPMAERLIFVDNIDTEPELEMLTNQEQYGARERVSLTTRLQTPEGLPQRGYASVSVAEIPMSKGDIRGRNIRTYLLLDSELKGKLEDPDYFFEKDEPGRKRLLDQLMMTQGWRRFVWQDLLADEDPVFRYHNEQGFTFSGTITRPDMEKRELAAEVFLSSLDQKNFLMDQTLTNEEGKFLFSGYHFDDTTDILLQANRYKPQKEEKEKKKKKKKVAPDVGPDGNRNVDILLDRYGRPTVERSESFSPVPTQSDLMDQIKEDLAWLKALEAEYLKYKEYQLEEIVIEGKRKKAPDPFDRPGKLYREPSHRLVVDSIKGGSQSISIFQLIRGRVPGVEIVGTPGIDQTARIRGNNSFTLSTTALILLDGVPVSTLSANSVNVRNVEFIDVIKDLATSAAYGEAGRSGIIAIYTRQGGNQAFSAKTNRGVVNIQHPGYHKAREFYAPVYEGSQASNQEFDFRTTLYWTNEIRWKADGKATVEFFTGDREARYEIRLEGISTEGDPVSGRYQFEVKRE